MTINDVIRGLLANFLFTYIAKLTGESLLIFSWLIQDHSNHCYFGTEIQISKNITEISILTEHQLLKALSHFVMNYNK